MHNQDDEAGCGQLRATKGDTVMNPKETPKQTLPEFMADWLFGNQPETYKGYMREQIGEAIKAYERINGQ